MSEKRFTARQICEFLTVGWEEAYKHRAYAWFGPMPPDEHRRMMYCQKRADIAFEREKKTWTTRYKDLRSAAPPNEQR